MFALFLIGLLVVASYQDLIDEINSGNYGWTAGFNEGISDLSIEEKKALLRTRIVPNEVTDSVQVLDDIDLPDSFDSKDKWPTCITPIRDQGRCGSCWAHGASESFSDRWCIAKGEAVILSPQYIVSCDTSNYGCDGGYLNLVMEFLVNTGTVTDACDPYFSGKTGENGSCPSKCKDGSALKMYRARTYARIPEDVAAIQKEIYERGPVEVAFTVYEDFMNYKSGVYKHVSGGVLGGHAVKATGWGVDNGTPYWIIANSWNVTWGMKGYFWILRGVNECGIESQVYAVMP